MKVNGNDSRRESRVNTELASQGADKLNTEQQAKLNQMFSYDETFLTGVKAGANQQTIIDPTVKMCKFVCLVQLHSGI